MEGRKASVVVFASFLILSSAVNFSIQNDESSDLHLIEGEDLPARSFDCEGDLTCFCSPDNSYEAMDDMLGSVNSTLLISVYQIQNVHLTRTISNLSKDNVDVKLLVESDPVGGITSREMYCLDMMKDNGVQVRGTASEDFDHSYLHSKYMVADGTHVLVSSENFGYTGYPLDQYNGNRGWGTVLEDQNVAKYFKKIFFEDWNTSTDFETRPETIFNLHSNGLGFRPESEMKRIEGEIKVTPIVYPDDPSFSDPLIEMIDSADKKILVQQFYIDDWKDNKNPYLEALFDAADRGCEVKILLDSTWYNTLEDEIDNDDLVSYINNYSEKNNVDIEARLINRYHGFSKSHNKGMIVDGEKVLISSFNWNIESFNSNREVGIIIGNKEAARYFQNIFTKDWKRDTVIPIAEAGRNMTVYLGEKVELSGNYSWDDGEILHYRWDVDDDGVYERSGKDITITYIESGTYPVSMKVIDQDGHEDIDHTTIEVIQKKENDPSELYFLLIPFIFILTVVLIYLKEFH